MSTIKDNKYIWIAFWMWLSFLTPAKAASGEIDVQDIVFSHIQDAYTWHITEWNGQEIAIPLPILVKKRGKRMVFIPVIPSTSWPDASQLLYRRGR